MADVNVLVVFYSRHGTAEQLALAAGLGALQTGANIRLRRLADLADEQTIHADASWTENLDRMNRDYVTPRPADPVWADVLILATTAESPLELERFADSLRSIGSMAGKIAALLVPGNSEPALKPLYAAVVWAGLIVAPGSTDAADPIVHAKEYGGRVSQMARVLKEDQRRDPAST